MEEVKLLPCPACGRIPLVVIRDSEGNRRDAEYLLDPWSGVSYTLEHAGRPCLILPDEDGEQFFLYDDLQDLADAWNSLPRALTWTTEPPKVVGVFFAESTLEDGRKKITPIEVFPQDHWRNSDWEKRHGKLSCLLCLGGFGVCPVSKYSRFAGPIPMPKEQTL